MWAPLVFSLIAIIEFKKMTSYRPCLHDLCDQLYKQLAKTFLMMVELQAGSFSFNGSGLRQASSHMLCKMQADVKLSNTVDVTIQWLGQTSPSSLKQFKCSLELDSCGRESAVELFFFQCEIAAWIILHYMLGERVSWITDTKWLNNVVINSPRQI